MGHWAQDRSHLPYGAVILSWTSMQFFYRGMEDTAILLVFVCLLGGSILSNTV